MELTYSANNEYGEEVSRYKILRVVNDGTARYLETYNQVNIPEKDNDIYHIVKVNEDGRLDIISQKYFGTPNYWWAIAIANEFIDPFSVSEGTLVRIPRITELINPDNEILTRRIPR